MFRLSLRPLKVAAAAFKKNRTKIKIFFFLVQPFDLQINVFLFTFEEYVPVVSVSGFYEINRSLYGGVSIHRFSFDSLN